MEVKEPKQYFKCRVVSKSRKKDGVPHVKVSYDGWGREYFISFHSKFFIHGGPINQGWLLFRGPWKKLNYNVTKKKKNAKLD